MEQSELSQKVIGTAIEVHRALGPGLLESAYEAALEHQLRLDSLRVRRQVHLAVAYKGIELADAYRIDLLVEETLLVEIKSVEQLQAIHSAQLLTYLRFSGRRLGLLLNFNSIVLHRGVRRVINPCA